jgi:hypothetical protein
VAASWTPALPSRRALWPEIVPALLVGQRHHAGTNKNPPAQCDDIDTFFIASGFSENLAVTEYKSWKLEHDFGIVWDIFGYVSIFWGQHFGFQNVQRCRNAHFK